VVTVGCRRVEKAGRGIQQYAETGEASSDIVPAIHWASSCGVSVASVLGRVYIGIVTCTSY